MEHSKTDDWFDTLMVFMTKNHNAIANEWFKLCGWLLILSTFRFLSRETDEILFDILFLSSCVMLFAYSMFRYQAVWYDFYVEGAHTYIKSSILDIFLRGFGVLVANLLAALLISISINFAEAGSKLLHSKPPNKVVEPIKNPRAAF
ncbi:MAG: hypothetical protein IE880_07225 [Epsilonproteobacteria bacterium]|nr:hypothetical protein [Campylobacterota bacterium]